MTQFVRGAVSSRIAGRVAWLRRIPAAMRGKARLARWLLGDLSREGPCEIRHRDGVWIEVPGFGDSIAFFLLIDGVYEPRELSLLGRLAEPGSWIIDVGANVGALALPLLAKRSDLAGLLAVEADHSIAAMLERSIGRNSLRKAVMVAAAAGAQDGDGWFEGNAASAFGQGHVVAEGGSNRARVDMRRIDTLVSEHEISSVSVMKIDVEGYEHDVLLGATRLLAAPRPVAVLFEFYGSPDAGTKAIGDAQRLLVERDYRLFSTKHDGRVEELMRPVGEGFYSLLALRADDSRLAALAGRWR